MPSVLYSFLWLEPSLTDHQPDRCPWAIKQVGPMVSHQTIYFHFHMFNSGVIEEPSSNTAVKEVFLSSLFASTEYNK